MRCSQITVSYHKQARTVLVCDHSPYNGIDIVRQHSVGPSYKYLRMDIPRLHRVLNHLNRNSKFMNKAIKKCSFACLEIDLESYNEIVSYQ